MSARQSAAARRRVITLLNAIADLQEGDLLAVLKLDQVTPLIEFGENDMFELGEDGKIVYTPGWPPAPTDISRSARRPAGRSRAWAPRTVPGHARCARLQSAKRARSVPADAESRDAAAR